MKTLFPGRTGMEWLDDLLIFQFSSPPNDSIQLPALPSTCPRNTRFLVSISVLLCLLVIGGGLPPTLELWLLCNHFGVARI